MNESQKEPCKLLSKWVKSIGNHLQWVRTTSEGDVELLREKWISILLHIQGKHEWTGHNKFTKCTHQKLTKKQIKVKNGYHLSQMRLKLSNPLYFAKEL